MFGPGVVSPEGWAMKAHTTFGASGGLMSDGWPSDEIRDEASKLADENALPWLKIISANKEIARLEAEVAKWQERHNTACENYEDELSKRTRLEAEVERLRGELLKSIQVSDLDTLIKENARLEAEVAELKALVVEVMKAAPYKVGIWKRLDATLRKHGLLEE